MIAGVSFNGRHCLDDFGMILADKVINLPETQTNFIDVPGRNGPLDMTETISGDVKYKARPITLTFVTNDYVSKQDWASFISFVANAIHGQRQEIIFDDDPRYYYSGRCEINEFTTSWGKQTIVVECTCDPFKYNISNNATSL